MPSHDGVPLLQARGLQRSFGRVRILRDVSLSLEPGEVLTIIGPNGAGKTTLLRLLAGLMRPTAGEIQLLGRRFKGGADAARSAIGLLSHQSLLYDDLTLLENLAFAARLHGIEQPLDAAVSALESAGLRDYGSDLPRRLSRGLLQRTAIARALVHSPSVLLLDEPFTALDSTATERLRSNLRSRLRQGAGIVVVTHQLADVWELTSRMAVLIDGRWAIEEPRAGSLEAFMTRYGRMASA